MIGVLYEHPQWFLPLFGELDRRGLPYLRGHTRAIFTAQHYLAHLERLGVPVINCAAAYRLELSKARQLDLLAALGLPAPATRVVKDLGQVQAAADELDFPLVLKPNVGGSGAALPITCRIG